jgi:hypothetical protein
VLRSKRCKSTPGHTLPYRGWTAPPLGTSVSCYRERSQTQEDQGNAMWILPPASYEASTPEWAASDWKHVACGDATFGDQGWSASPGSGPLRIPPLTRKSDSGHSGFFLKVYAALWRSTLPVNSDSSPRQCPGCENCRGICSAFTPNPGAVRLSRGFCQSLGPATWWVMYGVV